MDDDNRKRPSLTKRHFIAAAEIVRTHEGGRALKSALADAFAVFFASCNDGFDHERFVQACMTGEVFRDRAGFEARDELSRDDRANMRLAHGGPTALPTRVGDRLVRLGFLYQASPEALQMGTARAYGLTPKGVQALKRKSRAA